MLDLVDLMKMRPKSISARTRRYRRIVLCLPEIAKINITNIIFFSAKLSCLLFLKLKFEGDTQERNNGDDINRLKVFPLNRMETE